ncbi:MAG: DUF1330 domain-containing protein [Saprospiraceae bacterium]|nr:DUF1330 domain-containing protein [Saprospiraceae bacterium]
MIYITQLIFIKEGKEQAFLEFESSAIPLMEKYNGKILYRIRPGDESFVNKTSKTPYEIHFISFETEDDLNQFLLDEDRQKIMHLKEESIESTILVKGVRM